MRLFNTQTGQTENFQLTEDEVTLCMCDMTPGETFRLDHAFTYCAADVFVRYLEMKGLRVKYSHLIPEMDRDHLQKVESSTAVMELLNVRSPDNFLPDSEADLLVLHHDCELSQPESFAEQRPFARFWLQTAAVTYKGQKLGKSQGNLVPVRDLLNRYSLNALRIYLAQQHYRRSWTYDEVALKRASQYAGKLNAAMEAVSIGSTPINLMPVQRRFTMAMDNDFDTLKGIASLLNLADEILFRAPNGYLIDEAQVVLQHLSAVFGLRFAQRND